MDPSSGTVVFPAVILIDPGLSPSPSDLPVSIKIEPEGPSLEVPVVKLMAPLEPASPAFCAEQFNCLQ